VPKYTLFVTPGRFWSRTEEPLPDGSEDMLRSLILESLILRRRITKGANVEAERQRYTTCLNELEGRLQGLPRPEMDLDSSALDAALGSEGITALPLTGPYLDLMTRYHLQQREKDKNLETAGQMNSDLGLGASVFPPTELEAHANLLEEFAGSEEIKSQTELRDLARHRADLVRRIAAHGVGFVEVVEELDNGIFTPPAPRQRRIPETDDDATQDLTLKGPGSKGWQGMAKRLRKAIEVGLESGGKVNMSDQPHFIGTQVLGQFLYAQKNEESGQVRVVYSDGSEARPFPIRMLERPHKPQEPSVTIPVALMSMRHLELDPFVDWAWFRNKEVSKTRPLAESDDFCFEYSINELKNLQEAYAGETVLLQIYHTGFEPAAIGFYRAVVQELLTDRGWLQVQPYYFRGGSRFESDKTIWM
jgi:hypothetical protein